MVLHNDPHNGPVIKAAKMALETGNASYVLIWVPEESENTLKNLLEKTCCDRSARKNMQNCAIDWFFETVNRLHYAGRWPHFLNIKSEELDEKPIVLMVEKAIETGNFEEITTVIPDTPSGDIRQRFNEVMKKKNYSVENIAAGRVYVSAFTDFIVFVKNLQPGRP
jgi:hypothetical protein